MDAPGRGDRRAARRTGTSWSPPAPRRASRSATSSRSSTSVGRGQPRHRAARVPDQGARPGPAALAALVARARARARSPTTATPPTDDRAWAAQERQRRAHQPRDAAHGHPPVAPALGDVPHAAALRRRRRAAHAARRSSAATSRTCCAGCAGSASTTASTRRSASPARRSATRPSSRRALCGLPVEAIDDDGSPQAERVLRGAGSARCSTRTRARARRRTSRPPSCCPASCADGHQTLAFTRSRRGAELVAAHARGAARSRRGRRAGRVAAYRAGYLPDGAARARAAARERRARSASRPPNALELGIDVGGLDAVVLNGFPGTLASMRQQVGPGRAHRPPRRGGARRGRRPARPVVRRAPERAARPPAEARGREPRRTRSCCGRRSRARRTSCRSPPTTSAGSATASTTRCASWCSTTC